jgi:DNA-directed RNA polymerase specialized sigma24 family protein
MRRPGDRAGLSAWRTARSSAGPGCVVVMGDTGRASGPAEHHDRAERRDRSAPALRRGRGGAFADTAVRQALESLYHAHYVSMVRLAALLTGDAIVAEDVAADSLAALLAGPFGARLPEPALFRWGQQLVIRSRRAARTRRSWQSGACGGASAGRPVWRSAPVIGLLASLSVSQREAIVLRHYLELSDEETAAVMGASLRAVRRSLDAASQVLDSVLPDDAGGCEA